MQKALETQPLRKGYLSATTPMQKPPKIRLGFGHLLTKTDFVGL